MGRRQVKLKDVKALLNATVHTGEECLDMEVTAAFGADLMSDVLAYVQNGTILLTGLNNCQVIRTVEMLDVLAVIMVRGKTPMDEVIKLAKEKKIVLLSTKDWMYDACGKLYQAGLKGQD
jgi:predicted transcriptional regulator